MLSFYCQLRFKCSYQKCCYRGSQPPVISLKVYEQYHNLINSFSRNLTVIFLSKYILSVRRKSGVLHYSVAPDGEFFIFLWTIRILYNIQSLNLRMVETEHYVMNNIPNIMRIIGKKRLTKDYFIFRFRFPDSSATTFFIGR